MRSVVAVVVLVACGGAQTPAPIKPIAVLDPGAEPREPLRQQLVLRVPEPIDVTMKLRATGAYTNTTLDTSHTAIDYPTIIWHETVEATQVETGTLVRSIITSASVLDDVVDPRMKSVATRQAEKLRGAAMFWHLDAEGRTTHVDSNLRALPPGLLESWVAVPFFPATPIGIGARWTQTLEDTVGGIHWTHTRTFTLTALDDTMASLTIDVAGNASSQALSTEPNASIRLTSGSVHVTAEMRVPLHGVAWVGDTHGTSELNLLIVRGHLRTSTTQSTEVVTHVEHAHM